MIAFACGAGADSIRFAELQNVGDNSFVHASEVFEGIHADPYHEGCEQHIEGYPVEVVVRTVCGIVNPLRALPVMAHRPASQTNVMYADSSIHPGWLGLSTGCHSGCHCSP